MDTQDGRAVSFSAVHDDTYLIEPNDLNFFNRIQGWKIFKIVDQLAATVAMRHSGKPCVTFIADPLRFSIPAYLGEALVLQASVNRVWGSSLEVGVKIYADNLLKSERRHLASWYLVFVAINEEEKSVAVCPVIPETDDERRRYAEADARRNRRLEKAKHKKVKT